MEENKNNTFGTIEKLALIAESVQTLFSGKGTIVFEEGDVPPVTGLVPDVIAEFVKVHATLE